MLEDWKNKHAEKRREKHLAKCKQGKHDWILISEDTMSYSYSSTGGCDPTYTVKEYVCRHCGETLTETEGNTAEYELITGDES